MSKNIDQTCLLQDQYPDAANFDARMRLHRVSNTNKCDWYRWRPLHHQRVWHVYWQEVVVAAVNFAHCASAVVDYVR